MYRQTVPRCCGIKLPEAVDRMPMRARQTRRHASVPVNQVSPPIRPTSVHVGIAAALGIHVHPPVRTRRLERAREVVESRNCFGKAMVPLYQQTFPGTGLTVGPGDCVVAFPVALT